MWVRDFLNAWEISKVRIPPKQLTLPEKFSLGKSGADVTPGYRLSKIPVRVTAR